MNRTETVHVPPGASVAPVQAFWLPGTAKVKVLDDPLEAATPVTAISARRRQHESAQLQECVDAALASMPAEWRRALELRFVHEMRGVELAKALRKTPAQAQRTLDHARQLLRQKLIESDCRITPRQAGPVKDVLSYAAVQCSGNGTVTANSEL